MDLYSVFRQSVQVLALLLPGALWCAFWLWAVNWKKVWPVLAEGGWAPVVLLSVVAALVWSRVQPGSCNFLGIFWVPNFWCQMGGVASLVSVAMFCGWLQGLMGYEPMEVSVDPPPAPAHDHGTGHGHH
jgi:hypothetical protein